MQPSKLSVCNDTYDDYGNHGTSAGSLQLQVLHKVLEDTDRRIVLKAHVLALTCRICTICRLSQLSSGGGVGDSFAKCGGSHAQLKSKDTQERNQARTCPSDVWPTDFFSAFIMTANMCER